MLFVYCGMVSQWDYISPRFPSEVIRFVDDAEPDEFTESLEIDGAIMLVVNTDWNGVNYYGFAPADSEIRFAGGVDFAESAVE
ncbi:hypothetical protein [Mycolicibacterium llatzerense]|uniref:hypothetical protein n=1 Tax=Mycolicibacterium llatzerense TaxID=280871 RepID=UPI0021B6977A|nr:hypothetical protein [Mycolicibacterium llatzerense]